MGRQGRARETNNSVPIAVTVVATAAVTIPKVRSSARRSSTSRDPVRGDRCGRADVAAHVPAVGRRPVGHELRDPDAAAGAWAAGDSILAGTIVGKTGRYQVFSPGTAGSHWVTRSRFNLARIPTGTSRSSPLVRVIPAWRTTHWHSAGPAYNAGYSLLFGDNGRRPDLVETTGAI